MSANDHKDVRSQPDARGRRLKSLRKMADLSRKDINEKYSISASTLQAWEEGKAGGLTVKGAQRVVAALRKEGVYCTLEWLLHGKGQSPYLAENKYLGAAESTSSFLNPVTLAEEDLIAKELSIFRQLNKDVLVMKVTDDGMHPFYQIGDTIAGRRQYGENLSSLIGRDCIVETKSGETLCRRLRKGRKAGHYHLQCIAVDTKIAEPYQYDVAVVSAASIIWHRRPA